MHYTKDALKQQAHFAIHIDTTKVGILPKLKTATDGRLLRVMQRFVYQTADINMDTLWKSIEISFNHIRNYYAHITPDTTVYDALVKNDTGNAYTITQQFLQFAYKEIPDPKGKKRILFDNKGHITEDGIIFFACTVSTREMANHFIGRISGYKRTDAFGQDLRRITLYYAYPDGYNLIASGTEDNSQNWRKAMEILDYIRKPVQGTYAATQAQQNRAKKDQQDQYEGLYDIRTQKNLFPYFATTWLESQYTDNDTISLSFLRKNGTVETTYKPDGKNAKKQKLYIIDKHNDTENYTISLPLYTPYRGTAVVAIIKNKSDIKSVLLSDMDLLHMVLLQLCDKNKLPKNKLPLQKIMYHDKKPSYVRKTLAFEDRVAKRLATITQRWQDCEKWTTPEKIDRIIWAFQNLIFQEKIADTRIYNDLRLEIINYQGRKAFKKFMEANAIKSPHTCPPHNRLNNILPEKGEGYESLLTAAKNCVIKWCDMVKQREQLPESDDHIHRILNVKKTDTHHRQKNNLSFIKPDFWQQYFKQNITLKSLSEQGIEEFNPWDFYHKDKMTDSSIPLPKTMFRVYLKDVLLYHLAQHYLQQQTGHKHIEMIGKKQCKITYKPKTKTYEITIPLHHIGKSYVMDSLPSGMDKGIYLDSLFTCANAEQELKTNSPTMKDILTAKQKLQQGMHDFCWRWLQCEQELRIKEYEKNKQGLMDIESTLKQRFENYDNTAKKITSARNKCLHSNIWDMQDNTDYSSITSKTAFKALSNLEKKLGIEKPEKNCKKS